MESATAPSPARGSRGLKMLEMPMAGMARRAHSRRAGRLGLALILMGMVTEGSSLILGASLGKGIPGSFSFGSTHRVAQQETTTKTMPMPMTMMTMMMMMHRSRKPGILSAGFKGLAAGAEGAMPAGINLPMMVRRGLGCLHGQGQGRGVVQPHRILGTADVSLRGASRPGEGGDAKEGEISGEVGENDWDGGTADDVKEAATAMVEKIRNLVKDGSPRKCLACLDGLAHEEDLGEDGKALVVEAVLRGLVKLSRFDLVADAWKVIKDEGLPASDHIATVVVKAMCRSGAGGVWAAMKVIGELEERKSGSWKDVYPVVCQARFSTPQSAEFNSMPCHVPCCAVRTTKMAMRSTDAECEKWFCSRRHGCPPFLVWVPRRAEK
jgi:hypothetical protein